jgi:hypothetical protein
MSAISENYTIKVQATVMVALQPSRFEDGLDNFKTSRWVSAARPSHNTRRSPTFHYSSLRRSRARHQPRKKLVLCRAKK